MTEILKRHTLNVFPALRYKNYRIFFYAQIISLTGHWMQTVAQGYLVFQITHSAFMVGLMEAIAQLPAMLLTLWGGVLADKFPKQNILKITQLCQFLFASSLGILIISGHINLISLGLLTFLLGIAKALDHPARISIITELVEKKDLHAATAMNMSTFNSARIVGPAVAGWLIVAFGVGWAFLLNGIAFIAPFLAYNFIKFTPHISKPHPGTFQSIKDGLSYAGTHSVIRILLLYLAIISIFGWSYTTILPVVAEHVFSQGAKGLGYLYSAAGAGSVLGAISVSAYTKKFAGKKLILFGGLLYGAALILFSLTPNYYMALVFLFLTGFGITTQNSTIQATIQHAVEDRFRGRVSSIQSLVLMGLHPVGSFQIGTVAEHFGSQIAVRIGGVVLFISAILLFFKTPKSSLHK
ncbi:hypothetical protein A3F00_03650 [Candidatus Daviesbacteria bacterium RIFCSPHIGHO2_12_FULL_37_11]|uniref:Major facilitator superfamily (MFS) profile domain-containing protein n=1 Tax=Candidatus Daviesbacteria bacterium RIFCSPHIGHO2_12_FULL_37_11 TaxID=1797777 RepID=A0A1F5KCS2_9BACT|nr:MAG: hypothetical protein A2769_00990 [Candidatus Daviesbacteria bacterium RIFCSPHIGHO2_01_FULL_37_27]OGE38737.1 MAG: hypothetical protein A3F00_03650 [Candidatus Daviesbacteria bacterium RIFCSPHIGHO2_12_FULL_37_11]OGE45826.1 MAG: hypothetical protein A3B39_01190 [Candidatus Daviesbacteria bacterium RIFCSPLOWO2_01_FULL_37_10]